MDGRHFRLDQDGPEAVGYKAMGVNLSDIAAMAGIPRAAVVAVALPEALGGRGRAGPARRDAGAGGSVRRGAGRRRYQRLGRSARHHGDRAGPGDRAGGGARAAARPGDAILVTGPLGGSLGSGRHLRPEPRIAEALALHRAATIHAMIDLSDGLSSDLGHILDESGGLGAILDAVVHPHPPRCARRDPPGRHLRPRPRAERRRGFRALPDRRARGRRAAAGRAPSPAVVYRIGEVAGEPGLFLRNPDGRSTPIEPRGFDHLRTGAENEG